MLDNRQLLWSSVMPDLCASFMFAGLLQLGSSFVSRSVSLQTQVETKFTSATRVQKICIDPLSPHEALKHHVTCL